MICTPPRFEARIEPVEAASTLTFIFRGNELLLREADLSLLGDDAIAALAVPASRFQPIGVWNDAYVQGAWIDKGAALPAGVVGKGLRGMFGRLGEDFLAVAGRSFQIVDWARTHAFCGSCGKPTSRIAGERALRCECGHSAYPRIAPAMMVLVRRGPAILLARNVAVPAGGRMSALAGFIEPGESIEECVHREVLEEVGLAVKDLRYFASQSWPFPHALMIAFTAEYASGDIRCDPAEIAEARWFGPGDPLPELSPPQSISRALIDAHKPGV
jgi:NAD+ diphosphatase